MRRKMAAGNWKMNGSRDALGMITELAQTHARPGQTDIVICPPAPLLGAATDLARGTVMQIGAQDCHASASGAHTGDISAPMIAETRATHVIVGHSERRSDHGETDDDVRAKAQAAWSAGLTAILCIGESSEDRAAGKTLAVIAAQLAGSVHEAATPANLVVAYEPIWAIGTGAVASTTQINEVHDDIRARLIDRFGAQTGNGIRLLYGGSVKADNAVEIFTCANVDGALVGGASLRAADFSPIISALDAS